MDGNMTKTLNNEAQGENKPKREFPFNVFSTVCAVLVLALAVFVFLSVNGNFDDEKLVMQNKPDKFDELVALMEERGQLKLEKEMSMAINNEEIANSLDAMNKKLDEVIKLLKGQSK